MNQRTRRTWVSIVIAALIVAGIVVVGFVGGAYVFLHNHMRNEDLSSDRARSEVLRGGRNDLSAPASRGAVWRSASPGVRSGGASLQAPSRSRAGAVQHRSIGRPMGTVPRQSAAPARSFTPSSGFRGFSSGSRSFSSGRPGISSRGGGFSSGGLRSHSASPSMGHRTVSPRPMRRP